MARRNSILNEYLVSLGFNINRSQLNEVDRSLKRIRDLTSSTTASFSRSVVTAAAGITTVLATATAGVAAYLNSVAQADLQTQLFSRRLWISNTAGRSLNTTLKSLGYTLDQIYDIAANPELTDQFLRLRSEINEIEAPRELDTLLKGFREINFEVARFKGLLSQGSRWVSYWFITDNNEAITEFKATLQQFNDYVKANLPQIARTISNAFRNVFQVVESLIWGFQQLTSVIRNVFDALDFSKGAKAGLAALAVGFLSLSNPIFAAIAAITAFILLLEDLYVWKTGGKSLLGDFWEQLDEGLFSQFSVAGEGWFSVLSVLGESLNGLFEAVENLIGSILRLFGLDAEGSTLVKSFELLSKVSETFITALSWLIDRLTDFVNLLSQAVDLFKFFIGVSSTSLEDTKSDATDLTNPEIANNPNFVDAEDFRVYQQRINNAENFTQLKEILEEYGTIDSLPETTQHQVIKQNNEETSIPGILKTWVSNAWNGENKNSNQGLSVGNWFKDFAKIFIPPWLKEDNSAVFEPGVTDTVVATEESVYGGDTNTVTTVDQTTNNDNSRITINQNISGAGNPTAVGAAAVNAYQALFNNKNTKGWSGTQTTIQQGITALTGGG